MSTTRSTLPSKYIIPTILYSQGQCILKLQESVQYLASAARASHVSSLMRFLMWVKELTRWLVFSITFLSAMDCGKSMLSNAISTDMNNWTHYNSDQAHLHYIEVGKGYYSWVPVWTQLERVDGKNKRANGRVQRYRILDGTSDGHTMGLATSQRHETSYCVLMYTNASLFHWLSYFIQRKGRPHMGVGVQTRGWVWTGLKSMA